MGSMWMQERRGIRYGMSLTCKVVISEDALSDLRRYVNYLIHIKKNPQAASNLLNDYDETIDALSSAGGSLKLCESPNMKKRNLRRINFLHHNYFMLYRFDGQTAFVTNIFHALEDADNKLR